jgi:hypothetical protein
VEVGYSFGLEINVRLIVVPRLRRQAEPDPAACWQRRPMTPRAIDTS